MQRVFRRAMLLLGLAGAVRLGAQPASLGLGLLCVGEAAAAKAALHEEARRHPELGLGELLVELFPLRPVPALELELRRGRVCHSGLGPWDARFRFDAMPPPPLRLLDLEVEGETWMRGHRAWLSYEVRDPGAESLFLYRQDGETDEIELTPGEHRIELPVISLRAGRAPRLTLVARMRNGEARPLGVVHVDPADWRARQPRVTAPLRRISEHRTYRLKGEVLRPRSGYPALRFFRRESMFGRPAPTVVARDRVDGRLLGTGTVLRNGSFVVDLDLRGVALGARERVDLSTLDADGTLGPTTTVHVVGE